MTLMYDECCCNDRTPEQIIVLCDSRAYYGPQGGLPANDQRIWPNIIANHYNLNVTLCGKIGWTCRDAYWALIQDPNLWAHLPDAKMVIIAVGGMDTLPSPLPTMLRENIRYIRPESLRRVVRSTYAKAQPYLSRLGWPQALPPRLSISYLDKIRTAIYAFRPDLPLVFFTPGTHRARSYKQVHNGYTRAYIMMTRWARQYNIPVVDICSAIESFFHRAGDLTCYDPTDISDDLLMNLDGIHWGFELHEYIAQLAIKTIDQSEII